MARRARALCEPARLHRAADGRIPRGAGPDYELLRDVVYYLHHYADRYHHPREDVAFERMVKRDPGLKFPINRLRKEHRVLDSSGRTLLKYLDDILEDVVHERAAVEAAAATYVVYYRQHLAFEEAEILPRAAKTLGPADWAAVADGGPVGS